tara:strand:+ start:10176 stop:15203 length:5028 start_codon:yes stop_codon:yes gene_type:complete
MPNNFTSNTFSSTYKDDHTDSDNYHRVLFNSGRALQARELTQLQSIIQKEITRFGSHVFKEGAAVNPGGVTVNNQYEFVKLNTAVNQLPNVSALEGVTLTSDSGISIEVLEAVAVEGTDPATLYVKYTDTSSGTPSATPIRVASSENLSGGGYTLTVQSTNTTTNPAVGTGTRASVHKGDFFAQGRFLFVAEQSKIISKYTSTPTEVLGLKIIQDVVTISDDAALYDNQGSTPNLASPGADRYRIRGLIDIQSAVAEDENFVTVANIKEGVITTQVTGFNDYNVINDVLALRTKEESGDYIAKQFNIIYATNDSDDARLDIIVGPGTAYVDGYRAHTADETILTIDKPRTTANANNDVVAPAYGSFFVCNGNRGLPNIDSLQQINLRSSTGHGGSTIGTARVRSVLEDNGNYNVYLFKIQMNAGQNIRNVRSIGSSTSDYFNIVLDNSNAVLKENTKNSLIFPLPSSRPQSLTDISLAVQRKFSVTTSGNDATISLSASGETFSDDTLWVMSANDSDASSPVISAGGAGSTTATLSNGPSNTAIEVLAYVNKGSGSVRTKTLKERTQTLTPNVSTGDILFNRADIYSVLRVSATDSDGLELDGIYDFDNGQRQNFYDLGRLDLISGNSIPATDVFVRYKYFEHGASGDFFAKNSYNGQVNYEDIPDFTFDDGVVVNLRDQIDFRPVVNNSGTFGSGSIINELPRPGDLVQFDANYYQGKKLSIVINREGILTAEEGKQALLPKFPTVPDDSLKLFNIEMKPYTVSDDDLKSNRISHRRFTMADIGELEQRVARVEEATSLSLLELETSTLNVLDASGNIRTKSGFFIDNFADNRRGFRQSVDHKASIDAEQKSMRPRFDTGNFRFTFDANDAGNTNVVNKGDYLTLSYTEMSYLKNLSMTGTENVNPFAVVTHRGLLELSPSVDNWHRVDYLKDKTKLTGTELDLQNFTPQEQELWNGWEWNWSGQQAGTEIGEFSNVSGRTTTVNSFSISDVFITEPERIADKIVQQPTTDTRMRSRKIFFRARGMKPNTEVFAFFGNTDINNWVREEPFQFIGQQDSDFISGYEDATQHPDSKSQLITDANGTVEGTFWLPNTDTVHFKTGTKQFKLLDITSPDPDNATSFAKTPYTATGSFEIRRRRFTQTRIVEIDADTVRTTARRRKRLDPLAQSFLVEDANGVYITSIKLRFKTKPTTGAVVAQLRPMVNGHPASNEILPGSSVFRNPGAVNISNDGSEVTTFQFDEPVFLNGNEEYAIVVLTDSKDYNLYVAEAGAYILGSTEKRLTRQATLGSLFKSQNGSTWEPDQTKDMTFELMRAKFASAGSIILENVQLPKIKLPRNSLTTKISTKQIFVEHRQHGFLVGDKVTISGTDALSGITAANINGTRTVTKVDGTGYTFNAGGATNATATTRGGGRPLVERQSVYSAIYPAINSIIPSTTKVSYSMKTTSMKSIAGNEIPYVKDASYFPVFPEVTNYLDKLCVIGTRRNEGDNLGSGVKSLTVKVDFETADNRVSPLIDLQACTFTTINNRIDFQAASATSSRNVPITYVAETTASGGSHLAKWLTIPVQLEEDAKGIKLFISANRPSACDFDVYYRTNSGDNDNLLNTTWTLASVEGSKPPSDGNPQVFREYPYLIGGEAGTLDDFTQFQIKIVMKSSNQAKVPVFKDLRVIALTA